MKKVIISIFIIILLLMCGCTKLSEKGVKDVKYDSIHSFAHTSFSKEKVNDATSPLISDEFNSSDESVHYTFTSTLESNETSLPIVLVKPHIITEEDAKRIAFILFGQDVIYTDYDVNRQISSSEIAQDLEKWTEYLDDEKLSELYADPSMITYMKSLINRFVDSYNSLLPNAPVSVIKDSCQWVFYPDEKYNYTGTPVNEKDLGLYSIRTETNKNDIPYTLFFFNRDKDDYKVSNINVFISENIGPNGLNKRIVVSELCSGLKPTKEQESVVREKAETLLDNMSIGNWNIDYCESVALLGYGTEAYTINVKAVPVINNIPAIRHEQLTNIKSTEENASHYYYTSAEFVFSPKGDLIDFTLISPIDIVEVTSDKETLLSNDELLEIAKNELINYDSNIYSNTILPPDIAAQFNYEAFINDIQIGLSRIKASGSEEFYYYIPSLSLKGYYTIINPQTSDVVFDSRKFYTDPFTFLTLNTVDGSIINTRNP